MIRAFVFLLGCSLKNRIRTRMKKLRQPKYLISALAGFAYLCFLFLNQAHLNRSVIAPGRFAPDPATITLVETGFALMILAALVFQWFSGEARHVLFDEAEVQFLFPAPVSRLALLHYRMAKAQTGILFATVVTTFILSRRTLFPHPLYLFLALWVLYSFLHLYRIAAVLTRKRLEKHGWIPGRQVWIAGAALLLAAAALWRHSFFATLPDLRAMSLPELLEFMQRIVQSGPVWYALMPFRIFVSPAFASALPDFALHLIASLLMLLLAYVWARYSSVEFQVAALGILTTAVSGQAAPDIKSDPRVPGSGRSLFRLSPQGRAWVAIYWKNLMLAGGLSSRQTLPALAAITLFCVLMAGASGGQASIIFGSTATGLAGFITILGPIVFREDLRADLKNMDLLKTYPMPGRAIVLGEVLAPATVLAVIEWALVLIAVVLLGKVGDDSWRASDRVDVGIGAALLLPCVSLIGVLVQNAAALLLPGWVQVEKEQQRGIEAMGQRLIASIATVFFLLIAAVPAGLVFGTAFILGRRVLGLAIIPPASMLAGAALLLEAAVGILWLGMLFDRFDPSKEF